MNSKTNTKKSKQNLSFQASSIIGSSVVNHNSDLTKSFASIGQIPPPPPSGFDNSVYGQQEFSSLPKIKETNCLGIKPDYVKNGKTSNGITLFGLNIDFNFTVHFCIKSLSSCDGL